MCMNKIETTPPPPPPLRTNTELTFTPVTEVVHRTAGWLTPNADRFNQFHRDRGYNATVSFMWATHGSRAGTSTFQAIPESSLRVGLYFPAEEPRGFWSSYRGFYLGIPVPLLLCWIKIAVNFNLLALGRLPSFPIVPH